jgi:hypothetical protein
MKTVYAIVVNDRKYEIGEFINEDRKAAQEIFKIVCRILDDSWEKPTGFSVIHLTETHDITPVDWKEPEMIDNERAQWLYQGVQRSQKPARPVCPKCGKKIRGKNHKCPTKSKK